MGDFLTAVSTVSFRQKPSSEEPLIQEAISEVRKPKVLKVTPTSAQEVLEILRSSPNEDTLVELLNLLAQGSGKSLGFDIRLPSPSSAKVINELIITTIPDFWNNSDAVNQQILSCLRNIAGIGAVLARLRLVTSQLNSTQQGGKQSEVLRPLSDLVSIFCQLLDTDNLANQVYNDIHQLVADPSMRSLFWKEFLSSVGTGKIIAAVAEAEDKLKSLQETTDPAWASDGSKYSTWLGRNVYTMMRTPSKDQAAWKATSQLCGKAFGIGYAARIVEEIHTSLTLQTSEPSALLQSLLKNLQTPEKRQFLELTIEYTTKKCPALQAPPDFEDNSATTPTPIAAASALVSVTIGNDEGLRNHLLAWLSDPTLSASKSFAARRAAVTSFAHSCTDADSMLEDPMQDLLEKTMKLFGENIFIKHAPIMQQEACAQTLLLTAGYIHRAQPMSLFVSARSSTHLNGMSNRLHASSPRARFLGMIAGMAISELVDKPGSKMNFDIDELKSPEARWYLNLVKIDDKIGNHREIITVFGNEKNLATTTTTKQGSAQKKIQKPKASKPKIQPQTEVQGPRVVEVLDDSDDDDDLVPYAKPDSDPEDEDEDPTLINRDKSKVPVYIRDLIAGLNDNENYDRHSTALKHAAGLIRRKTSFGKEVSDHSIELAAILVGLGDHFETENFIELRLQALIAVLISNPTQMAPWLASQVFEGDYSLSQRATILSVLGLGARELAGYKEEDEDLNPTIASTSFPSKQLPDRLHKIYTAERNAPVARIASKLERSMIQPMALDAADQMSGPNILKVRTFSSRMEVEKKRKTKIIPNTLAKMVAQGFFFPLTGRWWQNLQAYGAAAQNVHFQPLLLSTYLKTLALILHAAGSGTLSLPQMTAEFWELLLNVRGNALTDVAVLEAVLFALLTLLEVNEDKRRVAEEHSKQIVETQEWVELVFERVGGGGGGDEEGERIRMLAASVLMKTREVVDKYQRLLVGDMVDW